MRLFASNFDRTTIDAKGYASKMPENSGSVIDQIGNLGAKLVLILAEPL
jgi:hypothetical protein